MDLFEAEVNTQVQIKLEKRLKEIITKDPTMVIKAYAELTEKLEKQNKDITVKLEKAVIKSNKYDKFLDSDGYARLAQIADVVKVSYIDPSGKERTMGQNHFAKILVLDDFIVRDGSGFHIASRRREQLKGKAITKLTEKNEHMKSLVLFNAQGIDYIDAFYSEDTRVWYSTTDHEVYYE
jgi:phage antirepressor YoqD-like protein